MLTVIASDHCLDASIGCIGHGTDRDSHRLSQAVITAVITAAVIGPVDDCIDASDGCIETTLDDHRAMVTVDRSQVSCQLSE